MTTDFYNLFIRKQNVFLEQFPANYIEITKKKKFAF